MHIEVMLCIFSVFLVVSVELHNLVLQNALSDFSFFFFDELWNYIHSFLVF